MFLLRRWVLFAISLLACTHFVRAQNVFTTQPTATVASLGGNADFSFSIQVPLAFANLGVSAFLNGANVSTRFTFVSQSIGNNITTSGNFTTGDFTVRLTNVAQSDAGAYTFVATVNGFLYGNASQAVSLTIGTPTLPAILTQPRAQTVPSFSSFTLSVLASGSAVRYQWYLNGSAIAGATAATYSPFLATASDAGVYYVVVSNAAGSVTSANAFVGILSTASPTITLQPSSTTAVTGQSASFAVGVSNSLFPVRYQWLFNGGIIDGATGSSYTVNPATATTAGAYAVFVVNDFGSALSTTATLTVGAAVPPAISSQPGSATVVAGQSATFSVSATGTSLSYQWLKNGAVIPGATGSSYTIASATAADAGSFSVRIVGAAGSVDSAAATLVVNVAPVVTSQPLSLTIVVGQSASFNVSATGTAITYQWLKNGAVIPGATGSSYTIAVASTSDAGAYAVRIVGVAGTIVSATANLAVNLAARISNLSVRTSMNAGQTLIVGAVTTGPTQILVRGVGPTLASFGVSPAMPDPRLELYDGSGTFLQGNTGWNNDPTLGAAFASVGAFAFSTGSKDSALVRTLNGGSSVQLKTNIGGIVLVELYDAGTGLTGLTGHLTNASTRTQVGTGDNILIVGLYIGGTGTKRLLIRAAGPTLASFGVSGTLADPRLDVFASGNLTPIASNDNWTPDLKPVFASVAAFPLLDGSRDAALVVGLSANASYSLQVKGADGGTGEAIVEIYELP